MSLFETGLSTGEVSMADLFDAGSRFADRPAAGLRDLVEAACRGGWPACVNLDTSAAQDYSASYLQEVCRADIPLLGSPVVVTATGYGYRRDDGVLVVPLTALGP